MSGRIQQLMELLDDEDVTVQRLANFLLQDYSLTVKLLRTANSFRFNRSGVPVVSATHAIVMMGARTVRDLVSTIMVFEHYHRRSPGLRQLLMLSLLSAHHARELADRTGAIRSEEAYLLGMLRNLGEVLVAAYLPAEYAAVLRDMADHQSSAEAACRRILHFKYEQLAAAILRDWHMTGVERVITDAEEPSAANRSHTVITFAHTLTSAVYRQGPEHPHHAVGLLLQKYAGLQLDRDDVKAVLDAGLAGTRETFEQAKVQLNELRLRHQINAALVEAPDAVDASAGSGEPTPPEAAASMAERASHAIATVMHGVEDGALDLNKMVLMLLEATVMVGGFDRAVLALVSATRREVCGRFGLGRDADAFTSRFRFSLGMSGGSIGVAISRGQELTLAKDWELMPDEQRLLRTLNAGACVVLPLAIDGRTIGALYADVAKTSPPADAAVAVARQMRDAIITAITRRRSAATDRA